MTGWFQVLEFLSAERDLFSHFMLLTSFPMWNNWQFFSTFLPCYFDFGFFPPLFLFLLFLLEAAFRTSGQEKEIQRRPGLKSG